MPGLVEKILLTKEVYSSIDVNFMFPRIKSLERGPERNRGSCNITWSQHIIMDQPSLTLYFKDKSFSGLTNIIADDTIIVCPLGPQKWPTQSTSSILRGLKKKPKKKKGGGKNYHLNQKL